jgi:hypothetical protein
MTRYGHREIYDLTLRPQTQPASAEQPAPPKPNGQRTLLDKAQYGAAAIFMIFVVVVGLMVVLVAGLASFQIATGR